MTKDPAAPEAPYRQSAQRAACTRCGGEMEDGGTFTKDGALVCARCAALASIAEAEARAASTSSANVDLRPRFDPAWLRPRILRKHGLAVALAAAGAGVLGTPLALLGLLAGEPSSRLVGAVYTVLVGSGLWAVIVAAHERSRPVIQPPPGTSYAMPRGERVAVTALAGCGGVAVVLAVLLCCVVILVLWFVLHFLWQVLEAAGHPV